MSEFEIKVIDMYARVKNERDRALKKFEEDEAILNEKLKEMKDLYYDIDINTEDRHRIADAILCEIVRTIGGSKGQEIVDLFLRIHKWYA